MKFKPVTYSNNVVYFTNFDMVQAEINWRSGGKQFDLDAKPSIQAFNEYFGGGMSSVVFQEIRESRALAYSTFAFYSQASDKDNYDVLLAYVGTQADKFNDAVSAMNELLNNLPSNAESFEQAKQSILSGLEAERIIKGNVFFSYLEAKDLGINYDYRSMLYNRIQKMSFEDVKKFHEANIKGKKWAISVVGSKDKIKESDLKKYGELKVLTLEEIFGY